MRVRERAVAITAMCAAGACAAVTQKDLPAPELFYLDVPAPFDSTVNLAKFALRAVDGMPQLPRVRPQMTSVSIHYQLPRRGGGHTEVAIIAAVSRPTSDTLRSTRVELSAWLLEVAHQLTASQRRAGIPNTAITTNAPAIRQPRAVTRADTAYHRMLEYVLESFLQHGARLTR
jgi:hypothetical protein